MTHLPWRLLIFKGLVRLTEFVALDLFDLPAFKSITSARDDVALFIGLLLYFVSHEWSATAQRTNSEAVNNRPQPA